MTLKRAKDVLTIEAQSILALAKRIDVQFTKAVDIIFKCKGRVIVTGMGKTGIIGRKISATFSSTGTPSVWMHSAEAAHGDFGQVTREDMMILISKSGETEETKRLIPLLKKIDIKTIAMTANPKSNLAKYADVVLNISVAKEGCPLDLAPMASTTVTLAMGDALAASLIDKRKFKREHFAMFHPAGSLGRKLLLRVEDVMRTGSGFVNVKGDRFIQDVLFSITKARCGSACVVDKNNRLVGIFTDGDLRRHFEMNGTILKKRVQDVMTKKPTTVQKDQLAVEALRKLEDKKIDEIPVVDDKNRLVGLLDIQDLLKAGLF